MDYYRIYKLKPDGHIFRAETTFAETDDAAIKHAASLAYPFTVEIWQETRKVGTVEPPR